MATRAFERDSISNASLLTSLSTVDAVLGDHVLGVGTRLHWLSE